MKRRPQGLITEEWLKAAGLEKEVFLGDHFCFKIYPHTGCAQITCSEADIYGWDCEFDLPPVKTMADVRRLCEALGIPCDA
jgi:hypothetical protein